MKGYPVILNLKNKKCLVVGCGRAAYIKIKKLLAADAKVTIVAKEFNEIIKRIKNKFILIQDYYKKKYLKNKFLVIAATDNKNLNKKICKDAKKHNILACNVNRDMNSDFINMASFKYKNFIIAISSYGKNIEGTINLKNRIAGFLKK